MTARRLLVWLLRLEAVVEMAAFAGVLMPFEWMARVNDSLRLDSFPDLPLTNYLARSLSAFYVWHGAFTWMLTTDIDRYRPLLWFWAASFAGFGLCSLGIDLAAGLPPSWTWSEGTYVLAFAALIAVLLAKVEPSDQADLV